MHLICQQCICTSAACYTCCYGYPVLCLAVCLVTHGFINMMSAHNIARFMLLSGSYQLVSTVAVIVLIPIIAPMHQSADFVFSTFDDSSQTSGVNSAP